MDDHKAQVIRSYLNLGGQLEGICFQANEILVFFLLMERNIFFHILQYGRNRKISLIYQGSYSLSSISQLKTYF